MSVRAGTWDRPITSVTLRELIDTFRQVIHEEREYYIDGDGWLAFPNERAYNDYLGKQKGRLPSQVSAYYVNEHGLKVVYSDYEPTPEKARQLAEARRQRSIPAEVVWKELRELGVDL